MKRRVVITAVGVISSLGCDLETISQNLLAGNTFFEQSKLIPELRTCPVSDFQLKKYTGRYKNARYLHRGNQLAVAAALSTVKASGLGEEELHRTGLFVGSGPNLDMDRELPVNKGEGVDWDEIQALWLLRFLPNTAASAIATLTGIHGENSTVGTACSATLQAIGEAFRKVRDGYMDTALCGGGDSRLNRGGLLAYQKAQALFKTGEDPNSRYAPFDEGRNGFIPGEGGAFFLLEELEHALERGADIFCEVLGYGASMDGHNMTAPHPEAIWGKQAVLSALKDGNLTPGSIDVISTHGTGTELNDAMESVLIDSIYGEHKPALVAFKSRVGHLSAACGAMELALMLGCMRSGILPGNLHLNQPCDPSLNFVVENRSDDRFKTIMLQNFGFGGQNSALAIQSWKQ